MRVFHQYVSFLIVWRFFPGAVCKITVGDNGHVLPSSQVCKIINDSVVLYYIFSILHIISINCMNFNLRFIYFLMLLLQSIHDRILDFYVLYELRFAYKNHNRCRKHILTLQSTLGTGTFLYFLIYNLGSTITFKISSAVNWGKHLCSLVA